jgi:DNA-binding winged helix-turn-helix (wHTH) protein/tetratricopeptide (TPR) repeat protein
MDTQRGFRLGPWTVSPLTGEIASDGQSVHLEPKVMEVLVALASQAETVVLRDELLSKVWGARAATSDEPLTRCIAQLRQSLGDSSRNPRFIQTVPKRGYRLMVPVTPIDAPAPATPSGDSKGQPPRVMPARTDGFRPGLSVGLVLALAVAGLVVYVTFPIVMGLGGSELLDPCQIEQREQPMRTIDPVAYDLCRDGIEALEQRAVTSIGSAMGFFRKAMELETGYGSAIVNRARAMVLLPTYQGIRESRDCAYDDNTSALTDCYTAARLLLDLYIGPVPYIQNYVYGINGYVYMQERRWSLAASQFERAKNETPNDADMWQWYSQFLAAVGDLEGALTAIDRAHDLNPDSGVILDRFGVILMWLGRYDDAALRFREAANYPHVPYAASHLLWSIRDQQLDAAKTLLEQHARAGRTGGAWIDDFLAGVSDQAVRERAVAAVETAIQSNELSGQYVHGAWALLGYPERAIDAVLNLLDENPGELSVEFLFAPETLALRQQDRFAEIVQRLALDDYWSIDEANCPRQFENAGERDWCS